MSATIARLSTTDKRRNAVHHEPRHRVPTRMQFHQRLHGLLLPSTPWREIGLCLIAIATSTDGIGRSVRDRLQHAIASRLSDIANGAGHYLARIDHERFAILLDSPNTNGTRDMADRILADLDAGFYVDGHRMLTTGNAGIVQRATDSLTCTGFRRAAQTALRWAIAEGPGRCREYDAAREAEDTARLHLAAIMPDALDNNEFHSHYQPIVDLNTGRLCGMEALARWHHPEHGIIPPNEFIPLAESTGLIRALGTRLLHEACSHAAHWNTATNPDLYISVNLASAQIEHPNLNRIIRDALEATGLPPHRLQLEVTEHAAISSSPTALTALRHLASDGIRIALDDFGTGYSSLASLRDLPICEVKLAQEFISPQSHSPRGFLSNIVSAIQSLGHTITAEGIETGAQAEMMRAVGCNTGQGWHFGRPAPPTRVNGG
jgi:EAL domain-containing protein (putative c-di-GMP-specific phosphodiesterase class I)/GGDEF domain-containing protein